MSDYKILKEFMNQADKYECKDFIVFEDCTGGQIYYKNNQGGNFI